MKIVFLVRNYKPYNSAVGICISNIIEQMKAECDIHVICEKSLLEESDNEIINEESVHRIITKQTLLRKTALEHANKSTGISNVFFKAKYQFVRFVYNLVFMLSRQSIQKELVEKYLEMLNRLGEIDVLVPACMPIEGLVAANRYCRKHQKAIYIPILFDKFAANGTLHRTKWNRSLKWKNNLALEKEIFEDTKCKKVLYIDAWEKHIKDYYFNSKFQLIEHPLLKKIEVQNTFEFDEDRVNLVYAGALTKAGRNPEKALKLIAKAFEKNPQIQFHIFAAGDAVDIVKEYEQRYPECIVFHGQTATEIAHSAMISADILVSIGNTDITQTPSKLFEYMSCGKPIIHFAKLNADPAVGILNNYPAACCLSEEDNDEYNKCDAIVSFLRESKTAVVDFDSIAKIYQTALPQYTAALIKEV